MELINLLPQIKRARDFYLYDNQGNRILDLYLDDGRAICGHRPGGLSLALKNVISRGLYASYPSIYTDRLIKLLGVEFPRFKQVGLYKSESGIISPADPLYDEENNSILYWRPYIDITDSCTSLVVRFPFPGCDVIAVLSSEEKNLPPSDIIPPYILSGLIRSYFDFKKRLETVDRESWSLLDRTGHWKRIGPYLIPRCTENDYESLFQLYLKSGILISPYYERPSICAVDILTGSLKKLYRNMEGGK